MHVTTRRHGSNTKPVAGLSQQPRRPIAVLHIGRMDNGANQQGERVDEGVAHAARYHLLCHLGAPLGHHRPAVDDAGGGARASAARTSIRRAWLMACQRPLRQ